MSTSRYSIALGCQLRSRPPPQGAPSGIGIAGTTLTNSRNAARIESRKQKERREYYKADGPHQNDDPLVPGTIDQRKEERLQDVPIAVNVINAQALDGRGITAIDRNGCTGLDYAQQGPSAGIIYLRGVGSNDANPNGERIFRYCRRVR